MSADDTYPVPGGQLMLSGPTDFPELGTLPIRGDLAHIALAGKHFVPHYVMPEKRRVGDGGARLLCHPQDDSEAVTALAAGDAFELLDIAGGWAWGALGPHGPTGYLPLAALAPLAPAG